MVEHDCARVAARLATGAGKQLAQSTGLPQLREYVMGLHVVLYAHSGCRFVGVRQAALD